MTEEHNDHENESTIPSPFPSDDHFKFILASMAMKGICKIIADFSGSGDSGSVDSVRFYDCDEELVDGLGTVVVPWQKSSKFYRDGKWVEEVHKTSQSLHDVMTDLAYTALESTGLDWYNNDGGQGEVVFTMYPEFSVEVNVGINYTDTEDYSFHFSGTPAQDEPCTPTTTA